MLAALFPAEPSLETEVRCSFTMIPVQRKVQCVLWFAKFGSVTRVQREYKYAYKTKEAPYGKSIRYWDKQLKETGSLLKRPRSGRPSTRVREEGTIEKVREKFTRSPRTSIRTASLQLDIPRSSCLAGVCNTWAGDVTGLPAPRECVVVTAAAAAAGPTCHTVAHGHAPTFTLIFIFYRV